MLLLSGGVSGRAAAAQARTFTARKLCRYAVLIAARNESAVIAQLLESIRQQDYPQDLLDIYVVADNCTDGTASIAREHGARCLSGRTRCRWARATPWAFLLEHIREEYPQERYDGYFVFDADNLLDPHYVTEMNKVFSNGNRAVTGYRNTKNLGTTGSPRAMASGFCGSPST